MTPVPPIPSQRALFDIPREVAYLNCAYMSPMPRASIAAGQAALARKAHPWQIRPADFIDGPNRARALFAELMGCDAQGVSLIPSASYGLATAALNIPLSPGQRILIPEDQFPSNVHIWRRRARETGAELVTVAAEGDLSAALLHAIDDRTALIACAHCRWTDGALIDLATLSAKAREVGAALVLDLTQSAGALPIDLATVQPDFFVAATYKWLLGPYSMGFLYVAPKHRDGRPLEETWLAREGSDDFTRLIDYTDRTETGGRRFDMGQAANFALLPATCASLEQLLAWGTAAIQTTLAARTATIATRAMALGLTAPSHTRAGHYLALGVPGKITGLPERLATAHVHVSLRGQSLRITPHLYNDDEDTDRLIDALAAL